MEKNYGAILVNKDFVRIQGRQMESWGGGGKHPFPTCTNDQQHINSVTWHLRVSKFFISFSNERWFVSNSIITDAPKINVHPTFTQPSTHPLVFINFYSSYVLYKLGAKCLVAAESFKHVYYDITLRVHVHSKSSSNQSYLRIL